MLIAIGSTNPVKAAAAKLAFEKVFPNQSIVVVGVNVDSGVSNQPTRDDDL